MAGGPLPAGEVGLAVFFAVGLLGSVHCLGMCGPLVTLYADRMPAGDRRLTWYELRQHALFNAGRTASYAAVGAAMGAAGAVLYDAAALAAVGTTVRGVTGVVVGAAVVAAGVGYLTRGGAVDLLAGVPGAGGLFARAQALIRDRVDAWVGGVGVVGLGLLHGLLPCPLLYPAFLYAFGEGAPVEGGLSLAALGLGTFPTLFVYGTAIGSLSADLRSRLHRLLGVAFVLLGAMPLARGLRLLGADVPMPPWMPM